MLPLALLLASLQTVDGNATIRGKTEDSEIVVTTTNRCAGAIHSLTWRGKEFLDSYDHGRQLQSASNFDCGTPITGETYNPTEAGSRRDGTGDKSSSKLLSLSARGNRLLTRSQMAFWLAPGELSEGNPAKNTTVLSNHILEKRVTIGAQGRPHRIAYDVAFTLPADEEHGQAVFESLTGYMHPDFSAFLRFDPVKRTLEPLSDGPGEQADPVVLSTPDGAYAMGIFSPEPAAKGYGRWRFVAEKVVKWNCVFRVRNPKPGASYTYRHHVLVGSREQVRQELDLLVK
ncbi:MAG: hypothetical protein HZC36_09150 [Armatimonadetes bacterium]|nr:hypothetical protein [Armatimonadota bacterium]